MADNNTQLPFAGCKFAPGDKVRFRDVLHHDYASYGALKGVDVNGIFTVRSATTVLSTGGGDHDSPAPYLYQLVVLEEVDFTGSNDRFQPAEFSAKQ